MILKSSEHVRTKDYICQNVRCSSIEFVALADIFMVKHKSRHVFNYRELRTTFAKM